MLDCQVYGLNPGGHHFTSLLLHAVNAMLLFGVLKSMTGALWRSAAVAALFAWHPTHVESVAWAAERKDVLSTFFFLLTLWAYARYAKSRREPRSALHAPRTSVEQLDSKSQPSERHPPSNSAIQSKKSKTNDTVVGYWLALVFFALGLMSKPMLVTLPFVLLLLDYWPLGRLSLRSLRHSDAPSPDDSATPLRFLIGEKLPFFALSFAASLVTFLVQQTGGAVSSLATVPFGARLANAAVAYVRYLSKTIWPVDLAVFYPLPDHWPLWNVAASWLLLLLVSWLVLRRANRCPYLAVGWFWFVGILVPTIGLVQVGSQSMADRYTYIPGIGLFVLGVWGVTEFMKHASERFKRPSGAEGASLADSSPAVPQRTSETCWGERNAVGRRSGQPLLRFCTTVVPAGLLAAALMACLACTFRQLGYWHDEESLFRHAMQVTSDNYLAYDHLAKVYENAGRKQEAEAYYAELVRLKPRYPEGQYNLGTLLMGMGKLDEAASHLEAAVALRPRWSQAHSNLGITRFRQNQLRAAVDHLQCAASLNPQDSDSYINLGVTLLALNRAGDAADAFVQASRLVPNVPETEFLFALALSRQPNPAGALVQAEKARALAVASGRREVVLKANELIRLCQSETPALQRP